MSNFVGKNFVSISQQPVDDITWQVYQGHIFPFKYILNTLLAQHNRVECGEFGGGAGSLIKAIKQGMPDAPVSYTNIDESSSLLKQDDISNRKIHCHIENYDGKELYDIAYMRYVLQYNSLEKQKLILTKAKAALRPGGIFVLHFAGPLDRLHQYKLQQAFTTDAVAKALIRPGCYWSLWTEVNTILQSLAFTPFIWERYQLPVGSLFQSRYRLNEEEQSRFESLTHPYSFLEYVITSQQKV